MPTPLRKALADIADWDLVCLVHEKGEQAVNLTDQQRNDACDLAWLHQDGYGVPGYEPPQGWDWSGIRDSSPEGKANMARAIRTMLERDGVTHLDIVAETGR